MPCVEPQRPMRSVGWWLNASALVVLPAAAAVLGLSPALFLGESVYLPVVTFGATVALAVLSQLVKRDRLPNDRPDLQRLTLAFVGAIYPPAIFALVLLGINRLFWFVFWLVARFWPSLNPDASAYYATVVLGCFGALPFLILSVRKVFEGLTATPDGGEIARRLWGEKGKVFVTLGLGGLMMVVFPLWKLLMKGAMGSTGFVTFEVGLVVVGAAIYRLGLPARTPAETQDLSKAIGSLFEHAGFAVERFPEKTSESRDSSLGDLDMVATKGTRKLAVDIKIGAGQSVNWEAAAALGMARWALTRASDAPGTIDPLLVLIDARGDETLNALSERERIRVVPLSSTELRAATTDTDLARREEAARQVISKLTG